jgi:hypothetical protein
MFGHLLEVDPQTHVCGNCEYWKGFRRKDEYGRKVLIERNGPRAKCVNRFGPWFDLPQPNLSTCMSWAGWSELKG